MTDFISTIYPNIAGFSFVIGFLLLAHSHNRKHYISKLLQKGIKTKGRVVEIYRNPGSLFSSAQGEGFAPVVEYTTQSGNTLKHHSPTFRTLCKYKEGDLVDIWYINYRSRREAALADDEPGELPAKLFKAGLIFLIIALPQIITGLSKFS